ncbi:MAG TPA: hypothetical protein VMG12_01845 [Polyangiaceae bacterium]|nr:hypothetical protein [Polyangiaceae bacterium]
MRSIGTASAGIIGSLRRLRATTDGELAGLLYRAPSELVSGLNQDTGQKLIGILSQAGLDVALLPEGASCEAGRGEYEVALVLHEFDRMLAVLEEVMRFTGVDAETAQRLVCASPAVLVGQVSEATVAALRQRFTALGVEVDASRTKDATFDVAVEAPEGSLTPSLDRRLASAQPLTGADGKPGPNGERQFMLPGLDAAAANELWSEASRTAIKVRVLNRDFQRFDVRLEAAPASPEMLQLLIDTTGMSVGAAERVVARVPFILAQNVGGTRMLELLQAVERLGGRASGILLALRTFRLALEPGGDRKAARVWVDTIAGRAAGASFERPFTSELSGPFTKTRARWLQHELKKHGVRCQLVES